MVGTTNSPLEFIHSMQILVACVEKGVWVTMKKLKTTLLLLLCLLLLCVTGCTNPQEQLVLAMEDYSNMLQEGIPEGVRLTIYLSDLNVLYAKARTVDELIRYAEAQIIVETKELQERIELMKRLNAGELEARDTPRYNNALVYYIFEDADGNKILDVAISPARLGRIEGRVLVNGVCVHWDPIFYDLIEPFLTDDAHDLLGF